jgi:Zn-finger nucleic acid-binding protein/ribosomal protein L37AE/L43A
MANCPNCAAAIAVDVTACPSCNASFAAGAAWRPIPVSVEERRRLELRTGTELELAERYCCPRDGAPLEEDRTRSRTIWRCASCTGIFVESTIVKPPELSAPDDEPGPVAPCPLDFAPMVHGGYLGGKINVCSRCLGVWLDRSEIEKILGGEYARSPEENAQIDQTAGSVLDDFLMIADLFDDSL